MIFHTTIYKYCNMTLHTTFISTYDRTVIKTYYVRDKFSRYLYNNSLNILSSSHKHIPRLISKESEGREYNRLIISYQGQSLTSERLYNPSYYITSVLNIVKYFHDRDYIICDIKPNNFCIDQNGITYVDVESIQSQPVKSVIYTSKYAAPEVFNKEQTKRSDIYSLGVMFSIWMYRRIDKMKNRMLRGMMSTDPLLRPTIDQCISYHW
jgi:serine/threonine protein kinase